MDRRSFFSRIFGGAAAAAVAPHVETSKRYLVRPWSFRRSPNLRWEMAKSATLRGTLPAKGIQGDFVKIPPTHLFTEHILECEPAERMEVDEFIEDIPEEEFSLNENSTQDGLGVTLEGLFGENIPGCPIGYH